jgi:hypothetical protein
VGTDIVANSLRAQGLPEPGHLTEAQLAGLLPPPARAGLAKAGQHPGNPSGAAIVTGLTVTRTAAVARKELADFRRSRFIVVTMAIFPVIFLAVPTATILARRASAVSPGLTWQLSLSLLYLLLVATAIFVPAGSLRMLQAVS